MGNGDEKRSTAFTLRRNQRKNAGRCQRRRSRAVSNRKRIGKAERDGPRCSSQCALRDGATREQRPGEFLAGNRAAVPALAVIPSAVEGSLGRWLKCLRRDRSTALRMTCD